MMRGSVTDPTPRLDQKPSRLTELMATPARVWISISLFNATTRWAGPTAPSVSGGIATPLSPSPGKPFRTVLWRDRLLAEAVAGAPSLAPLGRLDASADGLAGGLRSGRVPARRSAGAKVPRASTRASALKSIVT